MVQLPVAVLAEKPKHLPAAKHNIIVKNKKRISKIVVDHVR